VTEDSLPFSEGHFSSHSMFPFNFLGLQFACFVVAVVLFAINQNQYSGLDSYAPTAPMSDKSWQCAVNSCPFVLSTVGWFS